MSPRPAVFLDRDDTVNRSTDLPAEAWDGATPGDLLDPAYVELLPGVRDACRRLRSAGFAIVVVTNQGGVARGHGTIQDVDRCHDALRRLLADDPRDDDVPAPLRPSLVDAFYACPFHPTGSVCRFADEHDWRKPGPGMIAAACAELAIDPGRSWMVGDQQRDLDAAQSAGIPASQTIRVAPDGPVRSLDEAARVILGVRPHPRADTTTTIAATRVSLRSHDDGRPLADDRTRQTVLAAARAIAERTGVELLDLTADDRSVTAVLAAKRIGAIGFMTELRRTTNAWAMGSLGRPLWNERDD